MKKILFAILPLCAGFSFRSQAQITIASTDMAVLNDTFRLSSTQDHWSVNAGLTGTGYNWDFSFLTPESQQKDTCVSVTSLPLAYQFYFNNIILYPAWKADYALPGQGFSFPGFFTMTDVYDFFKTGSTKHQNLGFGANLNGTPVSVRKNPIENVYLFPMNYGDTFDNYSEFEVEIPTIGTYQQRKQKHAEVDGWGTLTIPLGSFPVLRIRFDVNITDSIYVDAFGFGFANPRPTETHYHWLAQNKDVPLLEIVTDSATGTVTQIRYQDNYVPVGINEFQQAPVFNVYPNPASNSLTVQSAAPVNEITLYDLSGRIVLRSHPNTLQASVQLPAHIISGTYILECSGSNGIEKHRLVIQQ